MDDKDITSLLYREIEALVKEEKELRNKYGIGDRYKAITSRLESLFTYVQQAVNVPKQEDTPQPVVAALREDERYVFVHLFNAKGRMLTRWEAMLSPRLLQEYSVNRPVYGDQKQVEAYIRSRSDHEDHAFVVMKVARIDILPSTNSEHCCDPLGHPLLKLKEKALKEQGFVSFFHQGQRYVLTDGRLVLDVN